MFHGTAQAVRLINSLLYGKNENIPNIHRQFADNFRINIFHEISPKSFSQGFLLISDFSTIVSKLAKNFPEKIAHEFYQKHFLESDNLPKFSEIFETILLNVRFQFCLAAESIGQDGAIRPDDQPFKLRESREG